MQGFKTLVFLAVMVTFVGLVTSAAVDAVDGPAPEQLPAMLVRSGPAELLEPDARRCTNSACASLCRSLGWATGVCLNADWCLCYN